MFLNVTLIGNLGSSPELRYTPAGDAVTNFSVATNRTWNNAQGEKQTEVTWLRVSVWGKQAENCNQYLDKGQRVHVEGTLQPDKQTGGPRIWTDNEGSPRSSYEVRAHRVNFLGSRDDNAQGQHPQGQQQQTQQQSQGPQGQPQPPQPQGQPQQQQTQHSGPIDPDEIPF